MRHGTDLAGYGSIFSAMGRAGEGRAWTHRACALAVLLALAVLPARSQPPALGTPGASPGPAGPLAAPGLPPINGSPMNGGGCATCGKGGSGCSDCGSCCAIPAASDPWEIYVRGGVVTQVGRGGIEEHLKTGYTIQGGFREPISCPHPSLVLFADFGLGFSRNQGDNVPVITSGTFIANEPPSANVTQLADFFETRLVNLQRSQLHASLDADYYPNYFNDPGERWVHLTARAGIRVTDVRAQYVQVPTASLQNLISQQFNAGDNPLGFGYKSNNNPSDIGYGLFVSGGAAISYQDVHLFGFGFGDVTFGVELEYGYDWFHLGSFAQKDQGLGTLVPMASLAFGF